MARITAGELARKVVHMGVGAIAFTLVWLGPLWGAVCALVAIVFNVFILNRIGGRRLWRDGERERGGSIGIVLYPVAVLLLILFYWNRLEVAAAIWGILAFGDGMASVVGMTLGSAKLPWNPKKSWAGTFAYFLFGGLAAGVLLLWTAPVSGHEYTPLFAFAVGGVVALLSALLESMPQGLDDNLGVPLVGSVVLFGLLLGEGQWAEFWTDERLVQAAIGAVVAAGLGGVAFAARTVSASGFVGGFLVGATIWTFLGWPGFVVLLSFFVLGSALTKLGYSRKAEKNLAQEAGGRRGAKHAFANAGVAMMAAVFAATTVYPDLFALAFAAAFATAAADTAGSEVGQLIGKRTFLITTFKPVPPGTEGAVSVEGTVAGIIASIVVAVVAAAVGLFPWAGVWVVVVAAFIGTTLESLFGATLEDQGLLDNEAINFLNTLVGALAAAAMTPLAL
jgi:uncharacterized protein (TIGR00297 family)